LLVVPNVSGQAYVFAKGTLQDAGFAWRVEGAVRGYAANTVVEQRPAAGLRVVDTGAPLVVLRLAANKRYAQDGQPEDSSAYAGGAAGALARAPPAPDERERPVLALPERVDRHRRAVRLVARRAGAAAPRPGRHEGRARVGNRRPQPRRRTAGTPRRGGEGE